MQSIIDLMGGWVENRAGRVLVALALLTVTFAALVPQLQVETDITEFAGEATQATAFQQIDDEFGVRGGGLQVIVDAGRGGNVLSPEGLQVARDITEIIEETIGEALPEETPGRPAVLSYATPVEGGLAALDIDVAELTQPFVAALLERGLEQQGEELRSLLSEDLDVDQARARGGLVSVQFAPELDREQRQDAGLAVRDHLDDQPFGFFAVDPFSVELLDEELEEGLFVELPMLMLVSLLLILALLWAMFRSVADVLIAFIGLVVVQVWLAGLAALLGPGVLGIIGPFNQIAVAVPVMLVGLGVDYSVHLTARVREERAGGSSTRVASGRAVRTVGVALLLVTLTTMVGFLSNVQSPLPPIADFGVIVAAGMLAAFVVMGLFVPSARQLVNRRWELPTRSPGGGEGARTDRLLRRLASLSVRAPVSVIVVGLILGVLGTVAALDLDTEFAQEDFIPEGTRADRVIEAMEDLFGGDVTEETFLLVEGDMTDPAVVEAFGAVEDRIIELDDVQAVGRDEILTPRGLIEQLEQAGRLVQRQLVEQAQVAIGQLPVTAVVPLPGELTADQVPEAFADQVEDDPLENGAGDLDELGPGDLGQDDPGADAPAFEGEELDRRLPLGVDREDALSGLIDEDELAELLRDGATDEVRRELLDTMGQRTAEELAAADPDAVDLDLLEQVGYPVEELGEESLDLLSLVDDLEALGWHDGGLLDGADASEVFARVAEFAPDEVRLVLRDDRELALAIVPTEAGEPGADELREAMASAAEPLEEQGATVTVVSQQLVIDETLDLLVAAQVQKILFSLGAAFALLVLYHLVSQRRPMLGAITMVPTLLAVPLVLGSMWVLGLPFNALTATIASVAIGFGVDYGIHLSNRFREERERTSSPEEAVRATVARTGAALTGSAATTIAAFAVLMLSDLTPLVQFGAITAITMFAALIATVIVQSSCLLLWDRRHRQRNGDGGTDPCADSDAGQALAAP